MRQSLGSGKGDDDKGQDVKVLMLEGGIHNYLEWIKQERTKTTQQESLWLGKNYIFDARQSLGLDNDKNSSGRASADTDSNADGETNETSNPTATQLISSCEGCGIPCARYVKCDGFGCHRLIIACTKCSPSLEGHVGTGKSGMCCCEECVQMGEKVREYVAACDGRPTEGPRVKRGICRCERARRIELGED